MDSLQEQVVLLTGKVDALHQVIDQVNLRISEALASSQSALLDEVNATSPGNGRGERSIVHRGLDATVDHKDVLLDNTYLELETRSSERDLAPEIQIQRLTAQLTAAYNRIAALEEQLLASRVY
ncbi:MAG: hypothetical protein AAF215_07130 [Cyanobacteria bacterium P01_A01_bin.123]